MPQSFSTLRTQCESLLQDTANAIYIAANDIDPQAPKVLRKISSISPYIFKVLFTLEGRSGSATSTLANNLVDVSKSQFLSTDVGKIIYNTTDSTWAVITTYTSATTVVLNKDIMVSGESYKIFNKDCTNTKQINIEDVTDHLGIDKAEFPIWSDPPDYRKIDNNEGNIVTIGYDPSIGDTPKDVYLYFRKRHKVSQLTDFSGAVNNAGGYVAGATSMAINGLQATGTIECDQEFSITGVRGTYTVTADATIAGNAATIYFYPGLESAVAHTTVVTFKQSTLTPILEDVFVDWWAGEVAISKATLPMQECINAIAVLATANTEIGKVGAQITAAIAEVALANTAADTASTTISTDTTTPLGLIAAEIAKSITATSLAITAISEGELLINTIPTVLGADSDFLQNASTNMNLAVSHINNGLGYARQVTTLLQQGQAESGIVRDFLGTANGYLSSGNSYINETTGYLRKIGTHLSVANSGNPLFVWGTQKAREAEQRLRGMGEMKIYQSYERT